MVMASAGVNEGDGTAATSQECRRRRRFVPASATASDDPQDKRSRTVAGSSSDSDDGASSSEGSDADVVVAAAGEQQQQPPAPAPPPAWPVAFGCVELQGRMRDMEDTVSVHPALCTLADGEPVHFFAVFDGHGGPQVSALCRDQMHLILAAELQQDEALRAALLRSFARADAVAAEASQPGTIVGSTAVVALLVRDRLVVANCGDSRAVLCRAGAPVPLSEDQKPDRPDELARIEAAGGWVTYRDGARVRGILAMSRALGHQYLKPEVICEPEISITQRTAEDECLILASDGMWDVIPNDIACGVARQCLDDGGPTGIGSSSAGAPAAAAESPCGKAAVLLARLALVRGSGDNISVVVVDLKNRLSS